MRYSTLLPAILLLILVSCDDHPLRPGQNNLVGLSGRVIYDTGNPALNGTVYLFQNAVFFSFVDSASTDRAGEYEFTGLPVGPEYFVYARKSSSYHSQVALYVSMLSDSIRCIDPGPYRIDDLVLARILSQAAVSGQVVYGDNGLPADSADVVLYGFSGAEVLPASATLTDAGGRYSFSNVETGNYIVSASKLLPPPQNLNRDSEQFWCDGTSNYTVDTLELAEMVVWKPAIYIYPEVAGVFDVHLVLNNGTVLIESVPEYGSGWSVYVETSGRIERRYDYLFYEAGLGFRPGLSEGWCVGREDLAADLPPLLHSLGLNEQEVGDFMAYWSGMLADHPYYYIYPVSGTGLDQFVGLRVTPRPDAVLRVWFFFEGASCPGSLPEPRLSEFQRDGATVVEWGGVLMN
jgi:hypothetical protein